MTITFSGYPLSQVLKSIPLLCRQICSAQPNGADPECGYRSSGDDVREDPFGEHEHFQLGHDRASFSRTGADSGHGGE